MLVRVVVAAFLAAGEASRQVTWLRRLLKCLLLRSLPVCPARSRQGHSGSASSEHQQGTGKSFSQQTLYFSALNVSSSSMKCVGEGQEDDGWSLLR